MLLIALVVIIAAIIGIFMHGRLSRLRSIRIRTWRLLASAIATQLLAWLLLLVGTPAHPVTVLSTVLSLALTLLFCWRNRALQGVGLAALGLSLNAAVIVVNGVMPVSAQAAIRAGIVPAHAAAGPGRELDNDATTLRSLGKIIPVPLPVHPEVVSTGDLALTAGLAQLVIAGMAGKLPRSNQIRLPRRKSNPSRPGTTQIPYQYRNLEEDKSDVDSQLIRVMIKPAADRNDERAAASK